jgi:hypothetical protein
MTGTINVRAKSAILWTVAAILIVSVFVLTRHKSKLPSMSRLSNDHLSPLVRTDFSNEEEWRAICDEVDAGTADDRAAYSMLREFSETVGQESGPNVDLPISVNIIDDHANADISPEKVLERLPNARHACVFVVDKQTLSSPDHPILVVDLLQKPGRSFRTIPSEVYAIENNLSISNMDWEDFADRTDADGVFRGFKK